MCLCTCRWTSDDNKFVCVCVFVVVVLLFVCFKARLPSCLCIITCLSVCPFCPRGLTFTWWGRYGSCLRHEPTELAHSFCSVLVSISVFMAFSTVFHSINSPDNSVFTLYSSGPIPALLVLSTICLFMKVSFSPGIIPSG